jgi:hypothetical protein
MKIFRARLPLWLVAMIGILTVGLCGGCGGTKPKVICAMKNPETGEKVELYKEILYKVPRGYDEKKHIEQWKSQQRKKGFTVEVRE